VEYLKVGGIGNSLKIHPRKNRTVELRKARDNYVRCSNLTCGHVNAHRSGIWPKSWESCGDLKINYSRAGLLICTHNQKQSKRKQERSKSHKQLPVGWFHVDECRLGGYHGLP